LTQKEVNALRTYEALYIITPELDDDGIQTVANEVEKLVTSNGGAIVRSEIWGRRKLAYEVKKFTEGNYVLLRFDAEPVFSAKLEQYFRLSDQIIRYLIVHLDEHDLRMEAEQQKRREDDLRAGRTRGRDEDDDEDDEPIGVGGRRGRRNDDDD